MGNSLKLEILVDDKGTPILRQFSDNATGALAKVETAGQKLAGGFEKTWAGMAVGANAVIGLFQQIAGAVQAPIEAYMESEKALLKMGMAMKNQGDFSRAALADFEDFAAGIQKVTAYEDDATLAVMGNLKSFGLSNEEVKRATKAALDFATAKANEGMSVEKASEMLGKAYLGNTTALGKYGIKIDETLEGSQKFAAALDQLNSRFGGSAEADLLTYAGQWKQLQNQWGDIQEFLGLVFLKTIEAVGFSIGLLGAGFWKTVETILDGVGFLTEKIGAFAKFIGLESVAGGIGDVTAALKAGAENAREAADAAIQNADANYRNMVSFDKVANAIDNMGIAGKRTQAIDEEAAKKRKQATEQILEAIRKAAIEAEAIGKSEYEQAIVRIQGEAEKYQKLGVDKALIAKFAAAEMATAEKKAYEEMASNARKAAEAAISEMERQIAQGVELSMARIKGSEEYRKLLTDESEFAATENQRAINKIIGDAEEKSRKLEDLLNRQYITEEEYSQALMLVHDNKNSAILEKETANARKIADINAGLIAEIAGLEQEALNARIAQISAQAAVYIKDGADRVAVNLWVANETEKAFIAMGKCSDDWRNGVMAGLLELQRAHTTWGSTSYEVAKQFAADAQKQLSDNFFNILTGKFDQIGLDWGELWEGMARKLSDSLANMLMEAAAKEIIMFFKSEWTSGGAAVLGIIDKVLGIGANVFGGNGINDFSDIDGRAAGGDLPQGKPVWVGERGPELLFSQRPGYVMNHHDSVAYAARNGGYIPGRADGGSVGPPLGGIYNFREISERAQSGGDISYDEAYMLARDRGKHFNYAPDSFTDRIALMASARDPYGGVDYDILKMEQIGDNLKRIYYRDGSTEDSAIDTGGHSLFSQIFMGVVKAWIAYCSAGIGGYAGAAFGAASQFAMALPGARDNNDYTGAILAGVLGGAAGYFGNATNIAANQAGEDAALGAAMQGLGPAAQQAAFEQAYNAVIVQGLTEAMKEKALNFAAKNVMGYLLGDSKGHAKITYEGADDGGRLESLSDSMQGMEHAGSFAFSARDGLDYVPRDNFRINAHEGEAVLDRQEADDWRSGRSSGGSRGRLLQPIVLQVDRQTLADVLLDMSHDGVKVIDHRGIVYQ